MRQTRIDKRDLARRAAAVERRLEAGAPQAPLRLVLGGGDLDAAAELLEIIDAVLEDTAETGRAAAEQG